MKDLTSSPEDLHRFLVSSESLDKESLLSLVASDDLDVAGVIYSAILNDQLAAKFSPPLEWPEVNDFLRNYYARCIVADADLEWADSRYSACWDAANWLLRMESLGGLPKEELLRWMHWMEAMFAQGNSGQRLAIETGMLEHIFADANLFERFARWKFDPVMAEPYERCRKTS